MSANTIDPRDSFDGNIGYLVDSLPRPRTLREIARGVGAAVLGAILPTPEQPPQTSLPPQPEQPTPEV